MKELTRRNAGKLFLGSAAATAAGARPARAESFSYRFGHAFALSHPIHTSLVKAAEKTKADTAGALDIEVLGGSQLGSDVNLLQQVRAGSVDFTIQAGSVLATLVPVAALWTVGFAFDSYADLWPAIDGQVGNLVAAGVRRAGLVPFKTVWDNGFREVSTTAKPIMTAADLGGMKMRVPVSPLLTSLFQALGTAPVSLPFGEVYSALQTRLVDGFESPLTVFESGNLYEVQHYIANTNHVWDGALPLGNKDAVDALPQDMRDVLFRNFDAEGTRERAECAGLATSLETSLTAHGITFTKPDTASMQKQLVERGFYKEWRQKFGEPAWAALSQYSPTLA